MIRQTPSAGRFRVERRIFGALALAAWVGWMADPLARAVERPRSPFTVLATLDTREGAGVVRFDFVVPPEHVIYADHLHFEASDGTVLTPSKITPPIVASDKATGQDRSLYNHSFAAEFKLDAATLGALLIKFQGCSNSACYFPEKRTFTVTSTNVVAESPGGASQPANAADVGATVAGDWQAELAGFKIVARETGYVEARGFLAFLERAKSSEGLTDEDPLARFNRLGMLATVLLIVVGGAGLNLTPCVLPLIPINLVIIGAGSRARSRREGFLRGAVYGAGMALVYGTLGLVVALSGAKFGTLNSSVWFNVVIAVVFVALGLAMFDLINIDFSRFGGRMGAPGVKPGGKGQWLAAFGLGAVAALLAGACVAPVVISVVLLSASLYGQGMTAGLFLPFLLGLGMALPWPFAGAGLSYLPKPGRWMTKVKSAFGVLILLFAAYYGYLAYELSRGPGRAPALAAAPNASANESLAAALQHARAKGQRVFIDFQASWCKNCVAMDAEVFSRETVQSRLRDFVVIKYDAEHPNESPAREVLDQLHVIGLPTYIVLKPES